MSTTETTELTKTQRKIAEFQHRIANERARYDAIVEWHLKALADAGIEPPYGGNETYINCNEYADGSNYSDGPDTELTLKTLKAIVKFARNQGKPVTKDYSTDFTIEVKVTDDITIRYYASRESVCTKKVTGTEVIPARTVPERIVEIVEWECEKIAFTSNDGDDA